MHRTTRPIVSLLAALAVVSLAAGPALAAEPPTDIAFDGAVTVTFTDPHDGPLPEADIALVASRPDLAADAVIQELGGQTGADGRIVFTGVARPADGASPIVLDVTAVLERPNDCGGSVRFVGSATAPAALEVTIPVGSEGSTSSCLAFPVSGTVLDQRGNAFPVASVVATVTYPGGEIETPTVNVEPDGAFAFKVHGWPGDGDASAELPETGASRTVVDPASGCRQLVALTADAEWALTPSTQGPSPRDLVARPVVLSEACGSQGTPAPGGAAVTLPPTDTLAAGAGLEPTPAAPADSALPVLAILCAACALAVSATHLSRRGS